MTKRWLYYTLIVGALPLLIRCFILLFLKEATWDMAINPIDFVFLGLTLNLTNIIELNGFKKSKNIKAGFLEDGVWISIIAIIFLAVNLGVLYLDGFIQILVLNKQTLKITSIALCVISLLYSLFIVRKLDVNKS